MKYAGNITILDDQGGTVYERDLTADEMVEELLKKPKEVTEEELDQALKETEKELPPVTPTRIAAAAPLRPAGTPCNECDSKGKRHKNGCKYAGAPKATQKLPSDRDWHANKKKEKQTVLKMKIARLVNADMGFDEIRASIDEKEMDDRALEEAIAWAEHKP